MFTFQGVPQEDIFEIEKYVHCSNLNTEEITDLKEKSLAEKLEFANTMGCSIMMRIPRECHESVHRSRYVRINTT